MATRREIVVCDIFQEIGSYGFLRIWSRENSRDAVFCRRDCVFFPFRNNSAAPTSSSTGGRVAIHGLILESVRKRWKTGGEESRASFDRWVIARRISRRFCCCCFRVKAIARAPSLHGSPSPTWFTFSYSTESAGRRCTSRLSAPLCRFQSSPGRRQVHRLSRYRSHAHVRLWRDRGNSDRFRFILSYWRQSMIHWLQRVFIIKSRWYLGEFVLESRRYFSIGRFRKKKISHTKKCQRGVFHW